MPILQPYGLDRGYEASTFYCYWLLGINLGLILPQTRALAAILLICFFPGLVVSEGLRLWKDPFFAVVGSAVLSFLLSPLIVLPACILLHSSHFLVIAGSLNLFLVIAIFFSRGKARPIYEGREHLGFTSGLIFLISFWVFLYVDITGFGPYAEDWIYLSGVVHELTTNFPPRNPEASFRYLKQPWGFWQVFAMVHQLGSLPVWRVFEILSPLLSFMFLGLVYKLLLEITGEHLPAVFSILFLSTGRHMGWVFNGLLGQGWLPQFNLDYQHLHVATGYSLLWGWYALPPLIPLITAFYFLIRYVSHNSQKDLLLSLGTTAIGPFFHPAYYLAFMSGFSIFVFVQLFRKKFRWAFLLYYLTFFPYYLTFYAYFQPSLPLQPVYLFQLRKDLIVSHLWSYIEVNGLAIPLAILAIATSRFSRIWILPFNGLFAILSIFGRGGVNPGHVWLLDHLFISMNAGIGLSYLNRVGRKYFIPLVGLLIAIILPPYFHEVSLRLQEGWKGIVEAEQVAAGEYIRNQTDSQSTFLSLPDSRYTAVAVEGIGERVLVFGFPFHLDRTEKINNIDHWQQEINHFFLTRDPQGKKDFIRRYGVDYIVLGPDEKAWLSKHGMNGESVTRNHQSVYKNPKLEILKAAPHVP